MLNVDIDSEFHPSRTPGPISLSGFESPLGRFELTPFSGELTSQQVTTHEVETHAYREGSSVADVSIDANTYDNVLLRNKAGVERSFLLPNFHLAARPGQYITVVSARRVADAERSIFARWLGGDFGIFRTVIRALARAGEPRTVIVAVHNHATTQTFYGAGLVGVFIAPLDGLRTLFWSVLLGFFAAAYVGSLGLILPVVTALILYRRTQQRLTSFKRLLRFTPT